MGRAAGRTKPRSKSAVARCTCLAQTSAAATQLLCLLVRCRTDMDFVADCFRCLLSKGGMLPIARRAYFLLLVEKKTVPQQRPCLFLRLHCIFCRSFTPFVRRWGNKDVRFLATLATTFVANITGELPLTSVSH